MSPDDEDTATEVSEGYGGTGPSIGHGTADTGASQEFSSFDNLSDSRGFDADAFEVAAQTYGGMGLATGLSQIPSDNLIYYYRLKNHKSFLRNFSLCYRTHKNSHL